MEQEGQKKNNCTSTSSSESQLNKTSELKGKGTCVGSDFNAFANEEKLPIYEETNNAENNILPSECIKKIKVFVSYSRTDYLDNEGSVISNTEVNTIIETLRSTEQIDLWVDVHARYSGKKFPKVLAKKILWADKLLFLSSRNSNISECVSDEILFANEKKKEIVVVKLDDSNYNLDFGLVLAGKDYIEYYKSPHNKLNEIVENLLQIPVQTPSEPISHPGRKGCLSLNMNYKGCALSMTILMGIAFVIGLFHYNNLEDESNLEVLSNTSLDSSTINNNDSHAEIHNQIAEKTTNPKKTTSENPYISTNHKDKPNSDDSKNSNKEESIEKEINSEEKSNNKPIQNESVNRDVNPLEPTETDADGIKYRTEMDLDKQLAERYGKSKKEFYELFENEEIAEKMWVEFMKNPKDKKWDFARYYLDNPLNLSSSQKNELKKDMKEIARKTIKRQDN